MAMNHIVNQLGSGANALHTGGLRGVNLTNLDPNMARPTRGINAMFAGMPGFHWPNAGNNNGGGPRINPNFNHNGGGQDVGVTGISGGTPPGGTPATGPEAYGLYAPGIDKKQFGVDRSLKAGKAFRGLQSPGSSGIGGLMGGGLSGLGGGGDMSSLLGLMMQLAGMQQSGGSNTIVGGIS